MELTQWLSPAIAIVVQLWRQTNSRIDRLGDQVNQVSGCASAAVADIVATIDRRLASFRRPITRRQEGQHGAAT